MFNAQWGHLTVNEVDGLRNDTFLVPSCSGALVNQTATVQRGIGMGPDSGVILPADLLTINLHF